MASSATQIRSLKGDDSLYTYSSQPHSASRPTRDTAGLPHAIADNSAPSRPIYRHERDDELYPSSYSNIMWDRRIIRGNTYAQHSLPTAAQPDPIEIQRQQEVKRRAAIRRREFVRQRKMSTGPANGREHAEVQTELYLEELADRIEEADVGEQTDAFLDRPPSPLFIPAKSGLDARTQIYDGELFDYNLEVRPILEVLVGKTIEQSLLEVMEEEELALYRSQQRAYEELRNAEIVEQQRLEEQERRLTNEKRRRVLQQKVILEQQQITLQKIQAKTFAKAYICDLIPSVFGKLSDDGYFYDPVERDLEQNFMPWLMSRVTTELEKRELGRLVVDGLIREVMTERSARLYQKSAQQIKTPLEPRELTELTPSPDPQPAASDGIDPPVVESLQLLPDRPMRESRLGVKFDTQLEELKEYQEDSPSDAEEGE